MFSISEAQFDALVDQIYGATVDDTIWPHVLTSLADKTGSAGGIMYRMAPKRQAIPGRSIGRLCPDRSTLYEERHFMNPWAHTMMVQPAGRQVLSDEIVPLEALRRSSFYADVLEPQGLGHSSMSVLVTRPDTMVGFTICRTFAQGPMHIGERNLLDRLLPHLQRASQLHLRVEAFDALREASLATLDRLTMGVVIHDRWGVALFANRSALETAKRHPWLLRDRMMAALPGHTGRRIRQLVHDAIHGGAGGAISVPDPQGSSLPLSLLVVPLRTPLRAHIGSGRLPGGAVAIFVRDPNQAREPCAEALAELFGLTPAESKVAVALLDAEDLATTASRLGVSVNTLKTHTKRIFAKTGATRRSQLVSLLTDAIPASFVQDT